MNWSARVHRRWMSTGLILVTIFAFLGNTTVSVAEIGLRVRFGLNDERPTNWDGTVEVSPGRVTHISGWRFAKGDSVDGIAGWKASTHPLAQQGRGNNQKKAAAKASKKNADQKQPMADNGVVISMTEVTDASQVTIKTVHGTVAIKLGDLKYGDVVERLEGAVELERSAAASPITSERSDDDYPATAVGSDGTTYVAYVSFTHGDRSAYRPLEEAGAATSFANSGRGWKSMPEDYKFLANPVGGDKVVLRELKGGKWGDALDVTRGGGDIYKCGLTVDHHGTVWICWSENSTYPAATANFEVFVRPYASGKLGPVVKLSASSASDINPVMATATNGSVWCAWQGVRDGVFRIVERHLSGDTWSAERIVSTQTRNCWTPAIAAAGDGRLAIAWDTYEKGDYDVWVREFAADGSAQSPRAAADTGDYEARPALTFDKQNTLWIAYELV